MKENDSKRARRRLLKPRSVAANMCHGKGLLIGRKRMR
jgi:hypothetical protein